MSAKEAVGYKYLNNQLSKAERHKLIIQLLNEQDNDIIKYSLFTYFTNNQNKAQHVNDIISTISQKRRETKH